MDVNNESNCFTTNKNHKEKFLNHPKLRLINPANNQLGRISKAILYNINMKLFEATLIRQLENQKTQ